MIGSSSTSMDHVEACLPFRLYRKAVTAGALERMGWGRT